MMQSPPPLPDRPPGEPIQPIVFGRIDSGPGTKSSSGPSRPSRMALLVGLAVAVVMLAAVVLAISWR